MQGKVLVVDDNAESRMVLSELLAHLDVNHTVVRSAGECISRLVADPAEFDIVLMDIHMPNLSGAEASQWIKASELPKHKGIPIIAVTGDSSFFTRHTPGSYGITDVLAKPFSLDQLRAALRKHYKHMRLN
jgi:CheY-like chemotaxis protein